MTREANESEMPIVGYQPHLAAQIAAAFVAKAGGTIDKLKLVKLLYLAEREAVRLYGQPIFFDENFSLPHGPAGTNALNGIDGLADRGVWDRFIRTEGRVVVLQRGLTADDFDDLSEANLDIVDDLHERFRSASGTEMRTWTHSSANVPEYVEVESGRVRITDRSLATALGLVNPDRYARHVTDLRHMMRGRYA